MINTVECYAGSSYPEKPRAFSWEDQHYQVMEIINRSRDPEGLKFFVCCSPGNRLFDLHYKLITGRWQIHPKGFISEGNPNNLQT
jgi:hypothetical protein